MAEREEEAAVGSRRVTSITFLNSPEETDMTRGMGLCTCTSPRDQKGWTNNLKTAGDY